MSDPRGYTAETAPPALRGLYDRLAPDSNAVYGTVLPFARDRTAGKVRPAMPLAVRDFLTGSLDLLAGVETGEVTPRAVATIGLGGLDAGASLAPREALAAGGARRASRLAMDQASRDARAKSLGFLRDENGDFLTFYHGTTGEISPGFRLDPPERTTNAPSAEAGIWTTDQPQVAQLYAQAASRRGGSQSILPLRARATRVAEIRLDPERSVSEMAMKSALLDAWDAGFDAVRITNYTTPAGMPAAENWVFKDPSQLRVPWAAFDPAKRDSSDLLAGFTVPGPAPTPGLHVQPEPTPGLHMVRLPTGQIVDEAIIPNALRPAGRRIY